MIKATDQHVKADMDISLPKAHFWLVVLALIYAIDLMDKMAISAVLPLLKAEFRFTDAQLGMIGSMVSLSVGLLALPVAMLVDKWSRRKIIAIMVGLWSIATFLTGRATGYISMLLARSAVGVGEAGYNPAAMAMVSAWYPQRMRARMIGLLYLGVPVGTIAGIVLTGILAQAHGWRAAFGFLAIPGLLLAVLAWFMPDYKTVKVEQNEEKTAKVSVWSNMAYIMKTPSLLFIFLTAGTINLVMGAFGNWGVTFLTRVFSMNVKQASMVFGAMLIPAMFGAVWGGWLGDKLSKKTNKGKMIAVMINAVLCLVMITIALQTAMATKNFALVVTFWSLGSFFLFGITPNQYTTVQDLAAPNFRATAAGFMPLCQQVLGGFLGPVIAGVISDRMGLEIGLQAIVVLGVALTVGFTLLAVKFYDRGIERRDQLGTFKLTGEKAG